MPTLPLLTMKPEGVSQDLRCSPLLSEYLQGDGLELDIVRWDGTILDIPPAPRSLIMVHEDMICLPRDLWRLMGAMEHVAFMNDHLLLRTGRFDPRKVNLVFAVARLALRTYPNFRP